MHAGAVKDVEDGDAVQCACGWVGPLEGLAERLGGGRAVAAGDQPKPQAAAAAATASVPHHVHSHHT